MTVPVAKKIAVVCVCFKIALQKLWSAQPFRWRIQEEEREKADFYTSQLYVAVILGPEGGHELGVMHGSLFILTAQIWISKRTSFSHLLTVLKPHTLRPLESSKCKRTWEFPGDPVVNAPCFYCVGPWKAWVQFLIGEQRTHKLHGMAKKGEENKSR